MSGFDEFNLVLKDIKKKRGALDKEKLDLIQRVCLPHIKKKIGEVDPSHESQSILNDAIIKYTKKCRTSNIEDGKIEDGKEGGYFWRIVEREVCTFYRKNLENTFIAKLNDTFNSEKTYVRQHEKGKSFKYHWWGGKNEKWGHQESRDEQWVPKADFPKFTDDISELECGYFDTVNEDLRKVEKKEGNETYERKLRRYSLYLLERKYIKYMQLLTLAQMENYGAVKDHVPDDYSSVKIYKPDNLKSSANPIESRGYIPNEKDIGEKVIYLSNEKVVRNHFQNIFPKPHQRIVFYLKWQEMTLQEISDFLNRLERIDKWRELGIKGFGVSNVDRILKSAQDKVKLKGDAFTCLLKVLSDEFGNIKSEAVFKDWFEKGRP